MRVKRRDPFHMETEITLESIGPVEVSTVLLQPELIDWETCLFWGQSTYGGRESLVVGRITPPWLFTDMEQWHDDWCKPALIAKEIAEHVRDETNSKREYEAWLEANGPE